MVRRHSRIVGAFYVGADALLGVTAFLLAWLIRFRSGIIPVTKGYPPFSQYVNVLPFIAVLVPLAFQFQGLYGPRRGRSRVDDFFAVFIGSIVAVVLGIVSTLYFQAHVNPVVRDRGAYEVSRVVWAIFMVLNVAFGQPTIAVDTHIFRVANRTGLAPGKNVDEVEQKLLKFVPEEFRLHAHHWLILHGRYVCTARSPKCAECAIRDLCDYRDKTG